MNLPVKQRILITYGLVLFITILGTIARLYWFVEWTAWQHTTVSFFSFFLISLIVESHLFINYLLNRWYPFERNIAVRIILQVFISIAIIKTVQFIVFPHISKLVSTGSSDFANAGSDFFFFSFVTILVVSISILINALLISFYFFRRWKESVVMTEKLEKEKALVQFEGLKNQLNPHFLFNAFSSLNSLINDDKELASKFLKHLSKVYRYILQTREQETVSLQTEMDFIQNYIFLLETRFSGMITITQNIEENAYDKKIVPVTTQNLLENAVKHNIISAEKPLHIKLYTEENFLVMENNLQRKARVESSNGEGLSKLGSLYRYLTPEPFIVEENQSIFRVKVPLISQ